MIMKASVQQDKIDKNDKEELISTVHEACMRLNSCLAESERVEVSWDMDRLCVGLQCLSRRVVESMDSYEKNLQHLEQTLRKHIKNEIQLKLYYEHLEQMITNLKKDREKDQLCIETLRTELRDKEKYLMTITNHNTKSGDEVTPAIQSKLDTITKIKNRLSLNDTGEFYARTYAKKTDRDRHTDDLHHKRQNLANALEKLCEKGDEKPKSKKKALEKSRSKSQKDLQSSKSGRNGPSPACSPANKVFKSTKNSKQKEKEKLKQSTNYIKSGLSSRRNSKC